MSTFRCLPARLHARGQPRATARYYAPATHCSTRFFQYLPGSIPYHEHASLFPNPCIIWLCPEPPYQRPSPERKKAVDAPSIRAMLPPASCFGMTFDQTYTSIKEDHHEHPYYPRPSLPRNESHT